MKKSFYSKSSNCCYAHIGSYTFSKKDDEDIPSQQPVQRNPYCVIKKRRTFQFPMISLNWPNYYASDTNEDLGTLLRTGSSKDTFLSKVGDVPVFSTTSNATYVRVN